MIGERQCSDCHKYGNPGTDGCRIMHQNGEKAFTKSSQNIHLKIPLGGIQQLRVPNFTQYETLLKVRQIRNDFFKPTFLPKNKQTNSTLLLVDLFSFVFWKKGRTPKRHFEIN
jgi:hypothetical protein